MIRQQPNAAQLISTGDYISLEMKRYIETTQTPGKYGYFTAEDGSTK